MQLHAAAFDELAGEYDASFVRSPVGSFLRELVWARAHEVLAGSQRVLELGCGTGEDALRFARRGASVLGIDPSPAMIRIAREKADRAGCSTRVQLCCLPAERLHEAVTGARFDAVFSNFGALNCVADLPRVIRDLSTLLVPGARLLWVLLGRHVPWEWAWYLLRAQPRRAFRRLPGATQWRGLPVHYPTPRELAAMLQPYFEVNALRPLGAVLPPSYAAAWLTRRPRVLGALKRLEQRAMQSAWPAALADHYIIEATHRPGAP